MALLLASTGLRISEALALRLADIDLGHGQLTIKASKFGTSRLVPLHPTTIQALEAFVSARGQAVAAGKEKHLFSLHVDGPPVPYANVLYTTRNLRLFGMTIFRSTMGSSWPDRNRRRSSSKPVLNQDLSQ